MNVRLYIGLVELDAFVFEAYQILAADIRKNKWTGADDDILVFSQTPKQCRLPQSREIIVFEQRLKKSPVLSRFELPMLQSLLKIAVKQQIISNDCGTKKTENKKNSLVQI